MQSSFGIQTACTEKEDNSIVDFTKLLENIINVSEILENVRKQK